MFYDIFILALFIDMYVFVCFIYNILCISGFVHLSQYKIPCHFHAFPGHLKKNPRPC